MESGGQDDLNQNEVIERFRILEFKVKELHLEKIWNEFEAAGFQPILIKGWAAARVYPEPFRRQYTDVDLVIAPDRYREALKFSREMAQKLPVDLHEGPRHLDDFSFEELYAGTVTEKCGSARIRMLRPEDHLRVLCVHWLTDGGAYREKLWDIYYAVDRRPSNFDWGRLLDKTSLRRRRWIVCTIGLAHKYLGLDIKDTPVAVEAKNLPGWLTRTVESEWASEIKLIPLDMCRKDRKTFWQQLKKRIPPNPIHATVMEEGEFDKKFRFHYQIKNMVRRLVPFLKKRRSGSAAG